MEQFFERLKDLFSRTRHSQLALSTAAVAVVALVGLIAFWPSGSSTISSPKPATSTTNPQAKTNPQKVKAPKDSATTEATEPSEEPADEEENPSGEKSPMGFALAAKGYIPPDKVSDIAREAAIADTTPTTEAPPTTPPPTQAPTTAAPVTAEPKPPPNGGPSPEAWAKLRDCEASGNYAALNPAGPYHGAYQFNQGTWDSVASSAGRNDLVGVAPSKAAPADQDAMAQALYNSRGAQPWPSCGRHLK